MGFLLSKVNNTVFSNFYPLHISRFLVHDVPVIVKSDNHTLNWEATFFNSHLREHVVDTDNAMRPRRPAIVNNGGVALHPDPATLLGQEAIVFCGDLPFHEY